ncbi:MAG: hypothetical protein ACJ8KO_06465 [Sulfurifustaceae bacterium]
MKLLTRLDAALPALPSIWPLTDPAKMLRTLIIVVPMVLAALYYGLIAADRYVAESRVVVKQSMEVDVGRSTLTALMGVSGPSREDALLLREYILSSDMLKRLDQSLKLRDAFAQSGLDVFYRLWSNATAEEFLNYYRARVDVHFDDKASMLVITTEGFTPEFAQKLNRAILAESEKFINDISHKIAAEQMQFAATEVERSRKRLDDSRDEMIVYQNRHGVLDPVMEAEAAGRVIADMEAKLAQMEAELRNMQTYLNSDTPQVIGAKNASKALQEQIATEKAKLVAPGKDKLNRVAAKFQEVKAMVELNADLYKLALASLEKTRVEAAQKVKSLVVIVSPSLPEEAERPRKLLILSTLLLVAVLLYGFSRLVWAVIQDHRD